jgi:hypothetical protein
LKVNQLSREAGLGNIVNPGTNPFGFLGASGQFGRDTADQQAKLEEQLQRNSLGLEKLPTSIDAAKNELERANNNLERLLGTSNPSGINPQGGAFGKSPPVAPTNDPNNKVGSDSSAVGGGGLDLGGPDSTGRSSNKLPRIRGKITFDKNGRPIPVTDDLDVSRGLGLDPFKSGNPFFSITPDTKPKQELLPDIGPFGPGDLNTVLNPKLPVPGSLPTTVGADSAEINKAINNMAAKLTDAIDTVNSIKQGISVTLSPESTVVIAEGTAQGVQKY